MRRAIVGGRRGDEIGLFIAKPGADALTADEDDLIFSITSKTEQLLLVGTASPLPAIVPLGLAQKPYVFLWSVGEIEADVGVLVGLQRPFPIRLVDRYQLSQVNVSASSMTITGGAPLVIYQVFRRNNVS